MIDARSVGQILVSIAFTRNARYNRRGIHVSKEVKLEVLLSCSFTLLFLQTKSMQRNFGVFEDLVSFDLYISDSGIPVSVVNLGLPR